MKTGPVVVVGDGWGALAAVGFFVSSEAEVVWVAGTGSRLISPLPTLESGYPTEVFRSLSVRLGLDIEPPSQGSFLREFKNKAFREPLWLKVPSTGERMETRNELIWEPEGQWVPLFESRFSVAVGELEIEMRRRLLEAFHSQISRVEGIPVVAIKPGIVVLGSGEEISCRETVYADRWSALTQIEGVPRPVGFTRRRSPVGVLQAIFTHRSPIGVGVNEGFYAALHKEAGEDIERHVWGYFFDEGRRSVWSVCLSPAEAEDNHLIAKKFRRIKNALNKMFTGDAWVPHGMSGFLDQVGEEQVHFEEAMIFSEGTPLSEPLRLPKVEGLVFMTDGYGPSFAFRQAGVLFGIEDGRPDAEAKCVDSFEPIVF